MEKSRWGIEAEDCVVLFADLQVGIAGLSRTNPLERLKKGVKALGKLANLLEVPVVVTGIRGEDGSPAEMIAEIGESVGEFEVVHRMTCDSFRSEEIVAAIEATGRRTLLISGVATEVAVQLAALGAADAGYRVYVVLDCCGGVGERTEQAALLRMTQAGVTAVSTITLAGEWTGDFREAKSQQTIGVLYELAQM